MTDKELIKQDKEPKCIYNRTLEERKKFCKYCSAACSVRIEEEPASKDLEEEVSNWRHNHFHGRRDKDASGEYLERESQLDLARHFAEWQKQKDFEELLKSDMTQFKKCYEKGKVNAMKEMKEALQTEYEKGRFDMREEMMKDAVDATIFSELKGSDGSVFQVKSDRFRMAGAKISDRIKVIPIKTEQQ